MNHVIVNKERLMKVFLSKSKVIANDISDLVVKKNHDYGDAWQRYGIFTPLIRINDKILRVQTLSSGEQALVSSENIADTLVDTIGYCLLGLLWLEENMGPRSMSPQEFSALTDEQKIQAIYQAVVHENDEEPSDNSSDEEIEGYDENDF